MRATVTPATNRSGKRRLLESCAITAGLMALAYGGPALGQVAGTGQAVTGPGLSTPTISLPGPGPTTVNTTGNQTIINWTPSNTPVDGVIDFLPAGNTLNFSGNGQYIVLNRFVSGAGLPIADQIAINGTVNSVDFATSGGRGGNIWFYNAGGILIGATGVINVGSLVLTANDIFTDSNGLLSPAGDIRFRSAAGSTSAITVNGAINANTAFSPGSSYVALVAPRVVQAGAVRVDGSVGYVAAEQADIRINGGLFDINVLVGAERGNVITHTGTTTGPAHLDSNPNESRIYMVAIPKNLAVTMLVSGQLGYDAVTAQTDPNGAIRLSAGSNILNGELASTPVSAVAANITVNDTLFRSNTYARASGAFLGQPLLQVPTGGPFTNVPPPHLGRIIVQGDGTFIGDASAALNVGAGQIVGATGNLTLSSNGANGASGSAAMNVTGGQLLTTGTLSVLGGGQIDAATGDASAGNADFIMTGGTAQLGALFVGADAIAADGTAGTGTGGIATIALTGGVLNSGLVTASAAGTGGVGADGSDDNPANTAPGGPGGTGVGGRASITIDGATVTVTGTLAAFASGQGGAGGVFRSFSSVADAGGLGGNGQGGAATIDMISGTLNTGDLIAGAGGFGGSGGNVSASSSSGSVTGIGIGGTGGNGQGGTATINLNAPVNASGSVTSTAAAQGGRGGFGLLGGSGGDALGGLAQIIVTDFDAGLLAINANASALGGNGASGDDGAGGNGGNATGGTGRIEAAGADGVVTLDQANFQIGGTGGDGGSAGSSFFGAETVGAAGGNGGSGRGGTLEVVASGGATVVLDADTSGLVSLGSNGTGGNGGNGAFNGFGQGFVGGDGGDGGAATGGTIRLLANGGTITSNGSPVAISVGGISGDGGFGGTGTSGNGAVGVGAQTTGGRALFEAAGAETAALVNLGVTTIAANGDVAGRIEMRTSGSGAVRMTSLVAEALGDATPTNNDTDEAPAGIFFAANGGTIATTGNMTLGTDSSFGAYARSNGTISAGGSLTIDAGDQIDIRHDAREGTAPTLQAVGNLTATAGRISGAPGSLLGAGGTLALTSTLGAIGVDRLDGNNIVIVAAGAASVEHAEADNDFTASGASFRTGLNSIITGGDIVVTSPGAVDLGNSTAGGFVQVNGQSILFNNVDAGASVSLTASGNVAGADGISGGSINAGSNVNLDASRIAIGGTITGGGSLFAIGSGGPVAINLATVANDISIFAQGDMTGVYNAVGNIRLNSGANIIASANATGFQSSSSGPPIAASVFADAVGNIALANSSAAGMFGVNAGGSASLTGASAGEDLLVIAGTTASLTNVTAGDDVSVRATGNIAATNVRATGAGPDTRTLGYVPGNGFTISQGEGTSATNGSDIFLSAGGSIDAAALSAADDIIAAASGTIALNGATTLGLGITGGASDIRTQGGDTTLAGLNAFTDVVVASTGTTNVTGATTAGRDVTISANNVRLADIVSSGPVLNTITAGRNIAVGSATGITGGALAAGGSLTLTAASAINISQAQSGDGAAMTLTAATGIGAEALTSRGVTTLTTGTGAVRIGSLSSFGDVSVNADSLDIGTNGPITFANMITDVGDATIRSGNRFIVNNAAIAGTARFSNSGEHMIIRNLTAAAADFNANEMISMTSVSVTGDLNADAGGTIFIDGVVTGRNISLASADIDLVSTGRVGTAGTTQALSFVNNNNDNQTFVGGTGSRNGYHIDAAELTRAFGNDIEIFAPEVSAAGSGSVGTTAPPDVIVDTFTLTGGAAGSNLGANGSLTITTPGKMRVLGNVQLTGLSDTNALNLVADEALEVILGQGTVRLLGANNAPGGQLNLESNDIIVATAAAITDVGLATTTNAIEARLALNDGIVLDEGALFARGIRADVIGGFYVQNSGSGTEFANRRGLTFGAGGLDVLTEGASRIVVNGIQIGPNGQVTGLDTIPLLTIGGSAPSAGSFDPRSTFNGCLIGNTASCSAVSFDFENSFPVQDVIEEASDADDDDGDGQSLPVPLITMRDIDPLSGEPLLDDPVTGAGNDDLWTPTEQP